MSGFIPGIVNGGVVLTGPDNGGMEGQMLTTDGTGRLSFITPAADLTSPTGVLAVANGGTGSTNSADARDALGAETSGAAAALLTAHLAAADPHVQYAKTTDLATKADLVTGTVPSSQLPALVVTDVFTVSSQSAQLSLTAQKGDIAIRTDLSKTFAHNGGSAGTMADWSELISPSDVVTSVNGLIGNVTLGYADVSAAAATHTHLKSAISDLETITATSTAGAIPKANGSGTLSNGWLNTGSGNGLDADTVDGVQAAALAQLSGAAFTGAVSTSGALTANSGTFSNNEALTGAQVICNNANSQGRSEVQLLENGTQKAFLQYRCTTNAAGANRLVFTTVAGTNGDITFAPNGSTTMFLAGGQNGLTAGYFGLGTLTPTTIFDVNGNSIRIRTSRTPASATVSGNAGEICWDSSYLYICTATNTWKRAALATW